MRSAATPRYSLFMRRTAVKWSNYKLARILLGYLLVWYSESSLTLACLTLVHQAVCIYRRRRQNGGPAKICFTTELQIFMRIFMFTNKFVTIEMTEKFLYTFGWIDGRSMFFDRIDTIYNVFYCFRFQKACVKYGVPDVDLFQAVDLMERKNIAQVTNTIFAIGRTVSTFITLFSFSCV